MKLNFLIAELGLAVLSKPDNDDFDIKHGYVSDLLSDVLANAIEGSLWITMQIHKNIVAIGSMKNLSGIILVNNRKPEQETLDKAAEENLAILSTSLSAFEITGKLYALGLTGKARTGTNV